jgi:uncharacterized protein
MNNWISLVGLERIDTHISWVFFDEEFAYKVKKPVDFGFLDFTSLESRKKYCDHEVEKNRALSPDIYLGVLPVFFDGKSVSFGEGDGELVDYCVKMVRLPEDRKMSVLLEAGDVTEENVRALGKMIFDFHEKLPASDEAWRYGSKENVKKFCDQNFEQTEEFVGKALSKIDFGLISGVTNKFLDENGELFENRIREKHVKDCHGDLHSANIFILENGDVKVFDALEFNQALSVTDTLSDVAFMVMDLDFHGREDLTGILLEAYGVSPSPLLNFYKCYRAYVRGKIGCFSGEAKKAEKYFDLARKYAGMF